MECSMQSLLKNSAVVISLTLLSAGLSACGGSTEKKETTVIHDRPVVQSGTMSSDQVESSCKHGYDNSTHSCY